MEHKIAGGNLAVGWFLWILANLAGINAVLQFIALILAITASTLAIRAYWTRK